MGNLLTTKTFWVGIISIATGLIEGYFNWKAGGGWQTGLDAILIGLGMITGRHAITKSQSGKA